MPLSQQRQGRITASQVAPILGISPFRKKEDVVQDWIYGSSFEGNVATKHGDFYEKFAVSDLAAELNEDLVPSDAFYIHPHHDWLGATPDCVSKDFICEIKCPYAMREEKDASKFKSILDGELEHYYAQVQIQLFCTQKNVCYFYQWAPSGISKMEKVVFDQSWIETNLPKLREFYLYIQKRIASLEDDESLAVDFYRLKKEADEAKQRLDIAKKNLIEKTKGSKRHFGKLLVYPIEKKGSISYAQIVKNQLPDLDLTPWTGEPYTIWGFK